MIESKGFRIREGRITDASALAEAQRKIAEKPGFLVSRPHELTDEKFKNWLTTLTRAENATCLVAEKDGRVIGHGMLDPLHLDAIRHVVHLTLAVHQGSQGQGVGTALLTKLIEWARSVPTVEKIELHVRSENVAAQSIYRKAGFIEEGRWRRRVKVSSDHYLDDVLMGLWVSD